MKKIVYNIFLLLLFIMLIYLGVQKKKNPVASPLGISFFQIQSGSMMPEIASKEVVILRKYKNYQTGDMITYLTENNYFITHRITEVLEEGYKTKGDANNTEDNVLVKEEQIKGKVVFHSKLLGYMLEYQYYIYILFIIIWLLW